MAQWLRENKETLKKQDAELKTSNEIFDREKQHLSTTNEILMNAVDGLQQRVADIQADIESVRQQVRRRT